MTTRSTYSVAAENYRKARQEEAQRKRLADAAPDLLAALRHAQDALYWHEGEDFEVNGRQARDVIAQAIAKATGQWETEK